MYTPFGLAKNQKLIVVSLKHFYDFNENSLYVNNKIIYLEEILNKSNYKKLQGNIKSLKCNDSEINIINEDTYNKLANSFGEERVLLMKAHLLESIKLGYRIFIFLAIFIGIIFFVTTASFLYNKCYMDIEDDKVS